MTSMLLTTLNSLENRNVPWIYFVTIIVSLKKSLKWGEQVYHIIELYGLHHYDIDFYV